MYVTVQQPVACNNRHQLTYKRNGHSKPADSIHRMNKFLTKQSNTLPNAGHIIGVVVVGQ